MHSATKLTPFQVVYGFNPLSPLDLIALPLKEQTNQDGKKKAAFVKSLHEQVKRNIEERTRMYARKKNKGRKELVLEPGDLVWIYLRKERFPNERKSKLLPRTDGPFEVLQRINNNAYKIDIPSKYNISSTFNVSDLIPYVADELDLRSNPLKGGGDDAAINGLECELDSDSDLEHMELNKENEGLELNKEQSEFNKEQDHLELNLEQQGSDPFYVSIGPVTRSMTKRLSKAIQGLNLFTKAHEDTKEDDGSAHSNSVVFNLVKS